MNKLKNQAQSIADRLGKLSKDLKVPYSKILTEFLIERLVVRLLADRGLSDRLVFKGGYVSLRVYHSPRYTIDLDALLKKGSLESIVETAQTAAERESGDGVWFAFEKTIDLETQGEYGGLRLVFRSGIGEKLKNLKKAQIIHFDIGKGDPVVPGPVETETPFLLGDGKLSWHVYPVETTVAEKLHSLIVRGSESSRSKDIFDLNLLLTQCNPPTLQKSLAETFRHRGETLPEKIARHIEEIDRTVLRKGWKSAIGDIPGAHDFDETFNNLVKQIKRIWK